MESSILPLAEISNLNTKLYLNCLENLDDEVLKKRPSNRTNNIVFIALHILDARHYIAKYIGLDLESPFRDKLKEVRNVDDLTENPDLTQIKKEWLMVSEKIERQLSTIDDSYLKREATENYPVNDKTILGCLSFLIGHESYHIGQMGLLRKYFGYNAMKY